MILQCMLTFQFLKLINSTVAVMLRGNDVTVRRGIFSVVDLRLARRTVLQKLCGDICMAVTITL
jgi:hypothetical protein